MKKSILATAVALSAGLFVSTAMAALPPVDMTGGTVHFSGNLIPAACEVSVASQNMAVDLGTLDLAIIQAAGGQIYSLPQFSITFENCDSAIASSLDTAFTAATNVSGVFMGNDAADAPSNAVLGIKKAGEATPGWVPMDGTVNAHTRVQITDGTVTTSYIPYYARSGGEAVTTITAGNTLYNSTYKVVYQ